MSTSEKEKMLAGEFYNASDPQLVAERERARELCKALKALAPSAPAAEYSALLAKLFATSINAHVIPPFFCDYGYNIQLGENVFFNFNCVVLDVAKVTIGNNVLFGPAVQIYTAVHPMTVAQRRCGLEFAKPINIGNDVWIGGGAIICPGVIIGDGSVIGAGSVVVRNIPANVFAAGNPCRVIREL